MLSGLQNGHRKGFQWASEKVYQQGFEKASELVAKKVAPALGEILEAFLARYRLRCCGAA